MPVAIGLYLLWNRQWRSVFLFSIALGGAYGLTLLLAPGNMLRMLLFVNTATPLSFAVLVGNISLFLKKISPAIVLIGAVAWSAFRQHNVILDFIKQPLVKLGLCGLIAWSLILLPASSKVGSSDNYHFIAALFLILIIGGCLPFIAQRTKDWSLSASGVVAVIISLIAFNNGSIEYA